ncbi:uncharacterized protein LOC126148338 [Schistocerca cancellata]|uniref:uncharacterized protein LOC126148338 n=1 Tax=Schistocerca cancellata TaxID=274614 RepID=UPI002119B655|nr:uncharacterized protein LOC126148338 [Schistocerca cancellata]
MCKNRWRNIRDSYQRNKRERKLGTGSHASAKPRKWVLLDHLAFLETVQQERQSISNISLSEETSDSIVSDIITDFEENTEVESPQPETSEMTEVECTVDLGTASKQLNQEPRPSGTNVRKRKKLRSEDRIFDLLEKRQSEREKAFEEIKKRCLETSPKEDDVDLFLRSMGLTMKSFHPTILAETKKKNLHSSDGHAT